MGDTSLDKIMRQTSVRELKKRTLRGQDGEAASLCTTGVTRVKKGN